MKSYNGIHCQEQQQKIGEQNENRLMAQNALYYLCGLHADILQKAFFFFFCLSTGSCQLL